MSAFLPERVATRDRDGEREITLHLPAGHACFAGHFSGRPIAPGIALLHWAVVELERWQRRRLAVSAVEALKFRRPLAPGETFVLRLARAAQADGFSFELRDDAGAISSGRVRVRP
ncbi:MAG TPA: hydroxymyristoyl-ACP dehydratase [Myxococcota bacterium]|nr:hydroxymyristoyl-ACP dehydratase [Myxococcota bacterium]